MLEAEKTLTMRLDAEERGFVEQKAEDEGRSMASWIRRLIRREMASEAANKPPRKRAR